MIRNFLLACGMLLAASSLCYAQKSDTLSVGHVEKREEKNRNVMLNAASSSKPREISTGLPGEDAGTAIFEDGMPLAAGTWPAYPYFHWAGGNSYEKQTLLKMEESALRSSTIGYSINSYTRLGTDTIHGAFSGSTSNFGLIRFDGNVNGPLGGGFYYTAGAYVNLDPTSVDQPSKKYVNNMQVYKLGLTKRWGTRTELSLLYKLSINKDGAYGYASGPFYYVGDGSVERFNGFKLGRDSYFPADDRVEYMDVRNGEMVSNRISRMNTKTIHDLMLKGNRLLHNGWKLEAGLHVSGSRGMDNLGIFETGIDEINNGKNSGGNDITDSNGTPYNGYMQNRMALLCSADYLNVMATASLSKQLNRHHLEVGLNDWFDYQYFYASTFNFAHTVEKNPARLYRNGEMSWGFNESTEYYRGRQNFLALYAIDDWSPNNRLNLYYGARLELTHYNIDAPVNPEGETYNNRYDGFHMGDGIARLEKFRKTKLNYVALANLSYRIFGNFFLSAEYLYAAQNNRASNYAMADMPIEKPAVKQLGRVGFLFDNKWVSITSMFSYITGQNNSMVLHFTKQLNGVSETVSGKAIYDIGTLGWTLDVATKFPHFNLHFLSTVQSPEYKDFRKSITFRDGSTETVDYSGNYVSGISKFLLEIDPSYQYKQWKVWLSARYFSKQYANRVNNVYFDGHWETFAGVDYQCNKHLSFSLNVVNLLNQTGASGSIDAADGITDNSLLQNYLTSGSYIRPFTVNFSVGYRF